MIYSLFLSIVFTRKYSAVTAVADALLYIECIENEIYIYTLENEIMFCKHKSKWSSTIVLTYGEMIFVHI